MTTQTIARLFHDRTDFAQVAPSLLALATFAAQRPGLEFGNYCSGWNDTAGRRAYFAEARAIARQLQAVRVELRICVSLGVTDADVQEACGRAFGGRLTVTPTGVDYCAGQYFCTEYRRAVAAVLDAASTLAYRRNQSKAA